MYGRCVRIRKWFFFGRRAGVFFTDVYPLGEAKCANAMSVVNAKIDLEANIIALT